MYCERQMKVYTACLYFKGKSNQTPEFRKKFKNEPIAFWENILFTDGSKFEIFGVKKTLKIWRSVNEELNNKWVSKSVKHGGGSE